MRCQNFGALSPAYADINVPFHLHNSETIFLTVMLQDMIEDFLHKWVCTVYPSHQIRSAWKWYSLIDLHRYTSIKTADGEQNF